MQNLSATDPSVLASRFINQTNKSVFLTGKAGTGKTTFLREIIQKTHKKTLVVAPTGIAAINAGGVTIHSQFQLPFGAFLPTDSLPDWMNPNIVVNNRQTIKRHLAMNNTKRQTLRALELLIIDEVSMLRADILDAIDTVLRMIRGDYFTPFGGVQVLFIGDLMQLPPVVKQDEWEILRGYYDGMFFFHSKVLQEQKPVYIELEKIYRQSDAQFIQILDNLRNNRIETTDLAILNQYYKPSFKPKSDDGYITLTTHNNKAAQQNQSALDALKDRAYTFEADIEDDFPPMSYPTDKHLILKKGAQIIFIKNDPTGRQRFYNGKIGIVDNISDDDIKVRFKGESDSMTIEKYEWRNIKYTVNDNTKEIDEEIIGTFKQYPIKLAWAITVHKSQGLTFERAIIDVNSAFAPGQVYVALSRLTSLEGLVLTSKISFNGISSDAQVIRFASNKKEPDEMNGILEVEVFMYLKAFLYKTFSFGHVVDTWQRHLMSYIKSEKNSAKQKQLPWAQEQFDTLEPFKKHADAFLRQLHQYLDTNTPDLVYVMSRLMAAKDYFAKTFESVMIKTRSQNEKMRLTPKTKEYQEELKDLENMMYDYVQAFRKAVVIVDCVLKGEEITKSHFRISGTERLAASLQQASQDAHVDAKPVKEKSDTVLKTYFLYEQGLSPQQIANQRLLSLGTIYDHLTKLMFQDKVDARKLMNHERFEYILAAFEGFDGSSLNPIKEKLGSGYSFEEIRLVKNYRQKKDK